MKLTLFVCLTTLLTLQAEANPFTNVWNSWFKSKPKVPPHVEPVNPKHGNVFRLVRADTQEEWEAPPIYTKLSIGSPAQVLTLQADLTLNDILLRGAQCQSSSCKGINKNRPIYDPSKSKTAKDTGSPARENYGNGAVTGEYWTDQVVVDGITAKNVGLAVLKTSGSTRLYKAQADGVFGLDMLGATRGRKALPSPLDSILGNGTKKTVQLWFNKAKSNADRYGNATFGKQSTQCSSSVLWTPSIGPDYQFMVQKVRSGKFIAHRELPTQLSPESPNLGLPTTLYNSFIRVLTGNTPTSGEPTISCSDAKKIKFDIKINGQYLTLNGDDLIYKKSSSSYCYLRVVDSGDEFDLGYILGEPFFRKYCTTYDLDGERIGFSLSNST